MSTKKVIACASIVAAAGLATAAELPLDFNWNGLVHDAEVGTPNFNVPDGYRSYGDRGLIAGLDGAIGGTTGSFSTTDGDYMIEQSAGVVDCMMIGQRTPDPDTEIWDSIEDTDGVATAPTWDPTGGTGQVLNAMTTLPAPVAMDSTSTVSVLYHGTQGGGEFDMTLHFVGGSSTTVTLHAPDWFANFGPTPNPPLPGVAAQALTGGPFTGSGWLGSSNNDVPFEGPPLNVVEAVVSTDSLLNGLAFDMDGLELESVSFDASSLGSRVGVGIFGISVNGAVTPLDYNWNGLVHASELNIPTPNRPDGYRSISDRSLTLFGPDSAGGGTFLLQVDEFDYHLHPNADEVDIVMIGDRPFGFDSVADNDNEGTVPNWDVSGGSGEIPLWVSSVGAPYTMTADTAIGLLYHGTNGGGDFFVFLEFTDGSSEIVILNTGDWFADFDPGVAPPDIGVESQSKLEGPLSNGDGFAAVAQVDTAAPGAPLVIFEAVISTQSLIDGLGFDATGKELEFLTFDGTGLVERSVAVFSASIIERGANPGCNAADIAEPFGTLNIDDVLDYLAAFAGGLPAADLAPPEGTFNIDDVLAFLAAFAEGC